MLAAIFPLAGFGVRDTRAVADAVLIEPHRIDAFRQESAAVGIDEPENLVPLNGAEISGRLKATVGDPAPAGFWHLS